MLEVEELTPRQIVAELDKYIIGQKNAKKSVAIALRNRWRRLRVQHDLREEIMPNNIIMIGPTGVGKTEIARRLARLAKAPFIKVEATKFTEVGYVGRDVESIIRDLVDLALVMVKSEKVEAVQAQAQQNANERLLDYLLPEPPGTSSQSRVLTMHESGVGEVEEESAEERYKRSREKLRNQLVDGKLEDRVIEIEVPTDAFPMMQVISPGGIEEMGLNLQDMFGGMFPKQMKKKKMKVSDARRVLSNEEAQKLIDQEGAIREAIDRVQNSGIVFLDEIDKFGAGGREERTGPGVSRQGLQRDLLPILEGTTIRTRHGHVSTENILFIAAGAFTMAKPSDLIPELQGRLPIRVELDSLTQEDFVRILNEPEDALTKQYQALLGVENLELEFTDEAVEEIARIGFHLNESTENIGARRLQTVMEKLMEELSYEKVDLVSPEKFVIDADYVNEKLSHIAQDLDLSQYIL